MNATGWSSAPTPQANEPALSPQLQSALAHFQGEAGLLTEWERAAAALEAAKAYEARLRLVVFELKFPNPKEGTQNAELPDGSKLKCEYKFNYGMANKEGQTEKAFDDVCAISQQAGFIAERLFKWNPDISITEYRLLNPDDPTKQTEEQRRILAALQPALTIKPGMPALSIVRPKA